jgi:excinuclease ABC subunit A
MRKFYGSKEEPGDHDEILGIENLDKVVIVDQSPIGRNSEVKPSNLHRSLYFHQAAIFSNKGGKN